MFRKFNNWWYAHSDVIAMIAAIIALTELFVIVLFTMAMTAQIELLHDIEVQLTAHGVDWALYTPAP